MDPATLALVSAAVKTFNINAETVLGAFEDDEDAKEIFRRKLQNLRLEIGFSVSPSLVSPFEQPPAPDWMEDEDTINLPVEDPEQNLELPPDEKELVFIKLTQLGHLVSQHIDIAISVEEPFELLTGEEIPGSIDSSSIYDETALGPKIQAQTEDSFPDNLEKIPPRYPNLLGSEDLDWTPYFPPIRNIREVKGKVKGAIFPGDSILIPLWVATPESGGNYAVTVIGNPRNPEIAPSHTELEVDIPG